MKKCFAVIAAVVLSFTLPVIAGPEPFKSTAKEVAPLPPPPLFDWTGFYVGVQAGWRMNDYHWNEADNDQREIDVDGNFDVGFAGLQIGYNRQVARWFVIGVEVSGTYGQSDDHQTLRITDTREILHFGTENDWGSTFALRAGFTLLENRLLLFAKGGGALSHWNYDYVNDQTLANSAMQPQFDRWHEEENRISPLVGAGAEYAIGRHWTAKAEWNRVFGGSRTLRSTLLRDDDPDTEGAEGDISGYGHKIDLEQDNVFLGLNYKF